MSRNQTYATEVQPCAPVAPQAIRLLERIRDLASFAGRSNEALVMFNDRALGNQTAGSTEKCGPTPVPGGWLQAMDMAIDELGLTLNAIDRNANRLNEIG